MATDVFWRNDLLVFDGNDRVLLGTTTQTTVVPVPNTSWTWKDAPVVSYKKNGGSLPAFPTFLPEGFPETAWSTDPRSESQPDSWVEDISSVGLCWDPNVLEPAEKRDQNRLSADGTPKTPTSPRGRQPQPLKRRSSVKKVSSFVKKRPESINSDSWNTPDKDTWTSWPYEPIPFPPQRQPNQVDPHVGALVEGDPTYNIEYGDPTAPLFENTQLSFLRPEDDIPFLRNHLLDTDHVNYFGVPDEGCEPNPGIVVFSVEVKLRPRAQEKCKCIVTSKQSVLRVYIDPTLRFERAVKLALPHLPVEKMKFHKLKSPELSQELCHMELRSIMDTYKFGVLYVKGEKTEDEIMGQLHDEASPDYLEFLKFLGEQIPLQGWDKYRGGLDVKNNSTGIESIYRKFHQYEIMFHVCTLLPSQEKDVQRIERKRHIGNDVVVLVFKESDKPFNVGCITSQFDHIVAVIDKVKDSSPTKYRLAISSKAGVAQHFPLLPDPPIFEANDQFAEFLFTKLINAERSVLNSMEFQTKMQRTRQMFITNIYNNFGKRK